MPEPTREQDNEAERLSLIYDNVGVEMEGDIACLWCLIRGGPTPDNYYSKGDRWRILYLDPDGNEIKGAK